MPASRGAYQHIGHGFEPVFDERSRVLVLGSFPSVLSRANDFYYGNPQNRFWRVAAACLGEPVPATIAEKRRMLLAHGIALWDVIASCDIVGSSDASIRNVRPADIGRVTGVAPSSASSATVPRPGVSTVAISSPSRAFPRRCFPARARPTPRGRLTAS